MSLTHQRGIYDADRITLYASMKCFSTSFIANYKAKYLSMAVNSKLLSIAESW